MTADNQKQRLDRLDRIFLRAPIYFITACTKDRRHLLANPAVHDSFLHFVKQGPNHGVWVGAYILMPDHVHAFVAIDDQKLSLSPTLLRWSDSVSRLRRRG